MLPHSARIRKDVAQNRNNWRGNPKSDRIVAGGGKWIAPEQLYIGMVFQDYALFPHLTVAKKVAFGWQNSRKKPYLTFKKVPQE